MHRHDNCSQTEIEEVGARKTRKSDTTPRVPKGRNPLKRALTSHWYLLKCGLQFLFVT